MNHGHQKIDDQNAIYLYLDDIFVVPQEIFQWGCPTKNGHITRATDGKCAQKPIHLIFCLRLKKYSFCEYGLTESYLSFLIDQALLPIFPAKKCILKMNKKAFLSNGLLLWIVWYKCLNHIFWPLFLSSNHQLMRSAVRKQICWKNMCYCP